MIVAFSGHQEMPAEAFDYADHAIRKYLEKVGQVTGVCSLAAGSDQLFARLVIESGGNLHVVVPCKGYEGSLAEHDLEAYRELLALAVSTETLGFDSPSEEAFYAAGLRSLELADVLVAVWDGKPAKGLGGTADIVRSAMERDLLVEIYWPQGITR